MDTLTLKRYYASFMEDMRNIEPLVWVQIRQRTISKADFCAALTRWATDINTSTKETK